MKPFQIASSLLAVSAALVVGGCYPAQPTTIYGTNELPREDWYTLSESSFQVESLDPPLRASLAQQRAEVAREIAEHGEISADTRKRIADLNDRCNTNFLVSFNMIADSPTPGMDGYAENYNQRRQNDAMIYNQNFRAMADEWSRIWLLDYPGGTPYNTLNTTGR